MLRRSLNRLLRRRVLQGHIRITRICHCGKELYGDFSNEDPAAVIKLESRLQKKTGSVGGCSTIATSSTNGSGAAPVTQSTSPTLSTSSNSSTSGTSRESATDNPSTSSPQISVGHIQSPPQCHFSSSADPSKTTSGLVGIASNPLLTAPCATQQNQYVEMCVNTGQHYQRLAEIDVSKHKTDAELFRWIRKRYRELRGWRTEWQYFLRPQAMSYVEFALDRKQKVHIYRSKDAYPPQADIDAGRYLYNRPPPPIPSNTFIHFLRECDLDGYSGSQDNEILEIVARKLDTRVADSPSLTRKAYGMLIHEGPDITAILWTTTIMVMVISLPLIAFIVVTKDVQSAAGLASVALAVVTLLWMGMQIDRGMNSFD